jgi:GNAT superfamily N-acetyltransferase
MISFRFIPDAEIDCIIPLLLILDTRFSAEILKSRLEEMLDTGYQCVGIYENNELIGVSGLWILYKYYVGKHIEPDNVILTPEYQGQGIGRQLMAWIYAYGQSIGCVASELNCYVTNKAGQKFWESEGYEPIGIHYQKIF